MTRGEEIRTILVLEKLMRLLIIFLVWVLGFGTFSIVFRKTIAKYVIHFNLPVFLKYYLILTPIILLEEALTIEVPYFWGIIPMIVVFYIFFLLLYLIQRSTRCSYLVLSIICGCLGWVNEFLIVGRIYRVDGLALVLLSVLCWLIYAVMAILPSAYLQRELDLRAQITNSAT